MFNRYIGNTGKYYRVDEDSNNAINTKPPMQPQPKAESLLTAVRNIENPRKNYTQPTMPRHTPARNMKKILDGFLPKGTEVSDILLILVLLLLYLEKEDEEILIILSVLIFNGFK